VSRRRRAALLLGLALVLGALAASDVARREAALRDQVGPAVEVLVARVPLVAGRRVEPGDLAVRRVPERFAPAGAPPVPDLLIGARLAVAVPAGAPVGEHLLARAAAGAAPVMRRGERAAEVVARGSPPVIAAGGRVDVVVTSERRDGGAGDARLALEDVEVLDARAAPVSARDGEGPQVAATLRVTVRQAVYLAAAGAFAGEIRLLARPPGDRRRTGAAAVGDDLTVHSDDGQVRDRADRLLAPRPRRSG
jgi:pilus assembly protein CpaB